MSIELTNENFESEVLKSDKPVLVDFWASWCGPCKMIAPIIEDLAQELGNQAKICKLNVDENQELAQKYMVMSIPMLIAFKNGQVHSTAVGVRDKESLKEMVLS